MAEWVMRNRASLNLRYVIWGQKIWSPTTDGAERPWTQWRTQEDRGDLTQNHWYGCCSPKVDPRTRLTKPLGITFMSATTAKLERKSSILVRGLSCS